MITAKELHVCQDGDSLSRQEDLEILSRNLPTTEEVEDDARIAKMTRSLEERSKIFRD